jgi:hypothetical protein
VGSTGTLHTPPGTFMTGSEQLFERFCAGKGLSLHKVPEGKLKSPDYYLDTSNNRLVIEVKQIDSNKEERSVLRKPPEEWNENDIFHWDIPGDRLRNKIASAMPQLRALSKGVYPTLLVVYDNIMVWPELTDEYAVRVAMYGIEVAMITSEVAPEGGAKIVERWYGPRKRVTEQHNTTLSAIAVMSDEDDRTQITVYHNWYAKAPMGKQVLVVPGVVHFELERAPDAGFCEWRRIS